MRLWGVVCTTVLAVSLLLAATTVSMATMRPTDTAIWYLDSGVVKTVFNPVTPPSNILVTVQQDVYDPTETATLLARNGNQPVAGGYLYVYTVTNVGWEVAGGIKKFTIDWGSVVPSLVTVDHSQENLERGVWTPQQIDGPKWEWTPVSPGFGGITLGGTAPSFWAVALTGVDHHVTAWAETSDGSDPLRGETTGPVPEPASILSLLLGASGLALGKFRRK